VTLEALRLAVINNSAVLNDAYGPSAGPRQWYTVYFRRDDPELRVKILDACSRTRPHVREVRFAVPRRPGGIEWLNFRLEAFDPGIPLLSSGSTT
jgi:hypothetical protein